MTDLKQIINDLFEENGKGINFSKYDESFLNKSIQKRMSANNCSSKEEYSEIIKQNPKEINQLYNSLMINHSKFFRNPLTFAVLERIVLPELLMHKKNSKQKEIRIWSAACAGGHEAYSLAILLEEMKSIMGENISYRIFASDQSETHINLARNGIYSIDSMNNISLQRLNQWFTKTGDKYTVNQALKERIEFSVFDLFNKTLSCPPVSIFGDFDLVFCANLLFYYNTESRKRILDKTTNCLASGGYLITGEAEREIIMTNGYKEVFDKSAIFSNNYKRKM
ncbi:MAG: protein-glutamate O-methyltransferase CheR [Candidatus Delongbacteria bacterium]|jgi:chemotaxis protein methyltransferase CheR|nr:protein-glutamate O-methyltransferase CheR [Candidatus Delongbacteria bacterium]